MGTVPSVGTEVSSTPRKILASPNGALYLPGGKIISGLDSRDPSNTAHPDTLRAGTVMGKMLNGKYAPSIIGLLIVAGTAAGATITMSAASGDEIARRIAMGVDVFTVVGPPTDGGTVAVSNDLGYSAEAAGVVTLAANVAVAEVQTSTLDVVMSAGTYKIGYKGEWTADIAFDATIAQMKAALDLLDTVTAGDITIEALHEPDTELTCTWTFLNTLGDVPMIALDITNATGPTTCTWAETTKGELVGAATLGANMAIGSLVLAKDGSQSPKGLLTNEFGLKVTDPDAVNLDVELHKLLIAGIVHSANICHWPVEESTQAWLKAQLKTVCPGFLFDDDF